MYADIKKLTVLISLKISLTYGGDETMNNLHLLQTGVNIPIGTIGRLINYTRQGFIYLYLI